MRSQKKIGVVFVIAAMLVFSLCALVGCVSEKPFALKFNGVAGGYEDGNLVATLNFSGAEESDGLIIIKNEPTLNASFRYEISEDGEITFDFDDSSFTASGSLHGKKIDVTAIINGKQYAFADTFYELTVKTDGEVTEEGYVTSGCPLGEVVAYPEETTEVTVNGKKIAVTELNDTEMPKRNTVVEISSKVEVENENGVVQAFNAIVPKEKAITQTATLSDENYIVTVITENYATEYILGKDLKVQRENLLAGEAIEPTALVEERSALERAYDAALEISGISPSDVVGFDFDRDFYMNKDVFKVEIEETGAKYKFIFDATDFSILDQEIEFENSLPSGSYISEEKALNIALAAAKATDDASALVVRSIFENGKKLYKVSFDHDGHRYDISVDAVSGTIVKYSKSVLEKTAPTIPETITADRAKEIALEFIFPDGADGTQYTFRKTKLDYDDGAFVYEVELIVGNVEYEFEISSAGEILDVEIDNNEKKSELPQNKRFITREQALAAVKELVGNDIYVLEIEIEKEGNGAQKRYYYEVDVRVDGIEREYHVDALTGKVELYEDELGGAVITEDDALNRALDFFGIDEQTVTQKRIKLERDDGKLLFEVKLYVGKIEYKAEIDALTGVIIKSEIENEDDLPPMPPELLTEDQAIKAVKDKLGENVVIVEVDLDDENGRYIYEIEVRINGIEYDYYVDAQTGEVSLNEDFVDGGNKKLSEDEALEIAFKFFKVDRSAARMHKIKLERDDGRLCYEIEFFIDSLKYEIDIDAETGRVLDSDVSYD